MRLAPRLVTRLGAALIGRSGVGGGGASSISLTNARLIPILPVAGGPALRGRNTLSKRPKLSRKHLTHLVGNTTRDCKQSPENGTQSPCQCPPVAPLRR